MDDITVGKSRHEIPINGNQYVPAAHLAIFMCRTTLIVYKYGSKLLLLTFNNVTNCDFFRVILAL